MPINTGKQQDAAANILAGVPPHDEAAEIGVLGAMMMEPRAADIAIEELTAEDFYLPRHRLLFTTLSELFEQQENLDELYVCGELSRRALLESVGGREAIGNILMATPNASGIEGYCRLVRDRATERELLEAAGTILKMAQSPAGADSQELVDHAEQIVFDIADKRATKESTSFTHLMQQTVLDAERYQAAYRENKEIDLPAVPTNYPDLDRLLSGGLWPGELIVIAGRPGMGKTTFALNIVRQLAIGNEARVKPAAIFSLEMPKEQVARNILCAEARLPGHKMRKYEFNEEEYERVLFFGKAIENAKIHIDDTPSLTPAGLRARCRRLSHREKISLVVVDYLQLMRSGGKRDSRQQEVAEISGSLKALARDLSIPVIVLSQLNRSAEDRDNKDKRPQLSDLRESGAIEQDADVVIMLYRPDYYTLEENAKPTNIGFAMVMKNRNGPVGNVKVTFQKDILRFDSYVPEHDAAAGA